MSFSKLNEFIRSDLIDILIDEASSRGRNASYARKMLLDIYEKVYSDFRTSELKTSQDLFELENVSYKALDHEMKLRGINSNTNNVEIDLPPLEE